MSWIDTSIAAILDPFFQETGSMMQHQQTYIQNIEGRSDPNEVVGQTGFHPETIEHLQAAMLGLAGNPSAQATLANLIAFGIAKDRVSKGD